MAPIISIVVPNARSAAALPLQALPPPPASFFAWTDGNNEEIFEAVDTSKSTATPEPGTWLLVGTGLLLFTSALRRKALR
jgi:hypothetical protein